MHVFGHLLPSCLDQNVIVNILFDDLLRLSTGIHTTPYSPSTSATMQNSSISDFSASPPPSFYGNRSHRKNQFSLLIVPKNAKTTMAGCCCDAAEL